MDDVEELEKQNLDEYVAALERTVKELDDSLKRISEEKAELFDEHVNALYKIYKIGE